jgi:serine/threonine-protein kinase
MTVPQGKVIGTDPPAGTKVKRGQIVTILISSGPPLVNVPDIAQGTKLSDAQDQLTKAGFKTTVTHDFNDSIAKDTVISINPTGQAPQGSTITIDVSNGPEFVKVPKIDRGTPVADAEAALTAAGLQYQVQAVGIGGGNAVLALSPDSGTRVRSGSTVTIYAI